MTLAHHYIKSSSGTGQFIYVLVKYNLAALTLGQCTLLLQVNGFVTTSCVVVTNNFFHSIFTVVLTNSLIFAIAPQGLQLVGVG